MALLRRRLLYLSIALNLLLIATLLFDIWSFKHTVMYKLSKKLHQTTITNQNESANYEKQFENTQPPVTTSQNAMPSLDYCRSYGAFTFTTGPAYFDRRLQEPAIKILMFGPNITSLAGRCTVYFDDETSNSAKPVELKCATKLYDNERRPEFKRLPEMPRYPQYMHCPVTVRDRLIGNSELLAVTANRHVQLQFNDIVPVRTIISRTGLATDRCRFPLTIALPGKSDANSRPRLDACIKMMHSHFDDWMMILQFMEWWLHSGMSQVWLHRYSNTPDVETVMQYYQNERAVMHILPSAYDEWAETKNTPYPVSMVQIQDCNLRLSGHADFVAHTDLDEYMTYRDSNRNTPGYLLNFLVQDAAADVKISGWNWERVYSVDFQSFQHFLESKNQNFDNSSDESTLLGARTVDVKAYFEQLPTKVNISGKTYPKMIVRPENVLHKREHAVVQYLNGGKKKNVPFDTLVMFHMRRLVKKNYGPMNEQVESPFKLQIHELANKISDHVVEIQKLL